MKKILTGIDIGSRFIKIVVTEFNDNKNYVLASTCVKSKGVKNGLIEDPSLVVESLNVGLTNIEDKLGVPISKAIITIPSNDRNLSITSGSTEILGEEHTVDARDVKTCIENATNDKVGDDMALVTVSPIVFRIDDKEDGVKDPIGEVGSTLSVKVVLGSVPKKNIMPILQVMKEVGIEVVDYVFSEVADYYNVIGSKYDNLVGGVINIGYDKMNVSVFNKGIMIKDEIIDSGSRNIEQDLMYIYKIKRGMAKNIKENFAYAATSLATKDALDIDNAEGKPISITNLEASGIVESRLKDLLELTKKQINLLTKREISYIIISGGISEMIGFKEVLDDIYGMIGEKLEIKAMGIRNNMYSSAYGATLYLSDKLRKRNEDFSMVDKNISENSEDTKESVLDKVFGIFG